jgi:hypothetical protein
LETAVKEDIPKLQKYLRKTFRCETLRVVMHPKKKDMAEIFVGDEFIATLHRDEEDGEVSYQLAMAILDVDLDEA